MPERNGEKVALAHGGCMAAATDAEHLCSVDCVPEPRSANGRPLRTHERSCTVDNHYEHTVLYNATCAACGCCWGCDDDCCAEAFCPNVECGCSRDMRLTPPEVSKHRYPCPTDGCPGDGRYAAPGRGHIEGCTSPVFPPGERPGDGA